MDEESDARIHVPVRTVTVRRPRVRVVRVTSRRRSVYAAQQGHDPGWLARIARNLAETLGERFADQTDDAMIAAGLDGKQAAIVHQRLSRQFLLLARERAAKAKDG